MHRPPFLFFSTFHFPFRFKRVPFQLAFSRIFDSGAVVGEPQKSERPVGVPAALAWGMEGLLSVAQSFFGGAGRSTALASSRTTHRSKIVMIIRHSGSRTELPTT